MYIGRGLGVEYMSECKTSITNSSHYHNMANLAFTIIAYYSTYPIIYDEAN